jgi:cell division protein FtsZ
MDTEHKIEKSSKPMVIGIGGAGVKIVSQLANQKEANWLDIVAIDTDSQSLDGSSVQEKVTIDFDWRKGQGCGGDVINGQRSFSRGRNSLSKLLKDIPLLIVTGGLGGGAATGGAPIIASVARQKNIPAIFIMTQPFALEGHTKRKIANDGIRELLPGADILLTLPNDLLFSSLPSETPVKEAFTNADIEVARVIMGIGEMMRCRDIIHADFADFKQLLKEKKSTCSVGIGIADKNDGLNRYHLALERMLESPLLGGIEHLESAHALILTLTGGTDLQIGEMKKTLETVERFCGENCRIIIGTNTDEAYEGKLQLTCVAIHYEEAPPPPVRAQSTTSPIFTTPVKKNSEKPSKQNIDEFEQGELPLQNLSKGIFLNSTPTKYDNLDLDIPTFQRELIHVDKGE